MYKFLFLTLISLSLFTLCACNEEETKVVEDEPEYTTIVSDIEKIEIEIDETYNLGYIVSLNEGMKVEVKDDSVVEIKDNVLKGLKVGESSIYLSLADKVQLVNVKVYEKGALSSTFSFDKERLSGKVLAAFGDSVTAPATIGGAKTYVENFATKFKMEVAKNYAIGGTTGTYMYEGSNIYKEYATNKVAIDGVRVVKNAYDLGELQNLDYVFIAYGHNDQYFQAPLNADGDDQYDLNSFASCHSFKGSYRYMINTLKLANPNVRIIILGCTYSEYDFSNPSRYGSTYKYADYIQAMKEIAEEFNLTYIDLWTYMMPYYDNYSEKFYYKDSVHLSAEGHKLLANYICNYR